MDIRKPADDVNVDEAQVLDRMKRGSAPAQSPRLSETALFPGLSDSAEIGVLEDGANRAKPPMDQHETETSTVRLQALRSPSRSSPGR